MNYKLIFLAALALILASCAKTDDVQIPSQPQMVTISVPDGGAQTRTILAQETGTKNITVKWKPSGDVITLHFKQGTTITDVYNVEITDVSSDGKTGKFAIPATVEGIDLTQTYILYGVHGPESLSSEGKIYTPVFCTGNTRELSNFNVPMYFTVEVPAGGNVPAVEFAHLVCLRVIHLKNTHTSTLSLSRVGYTTTGGGTDGCYSSAGSTDFACYDLISGTIAYIYKKYYLGNTPLQIPAGETKIAAVWGMPNGEAISNQIKLSIMVTGNPTPIESVNTKPGRAALEKGKAYHMYGEWNGTQLKFVEAPESMTFTTTKAVGGKIKLRINAYRDDQPGVWIDLNNNGTQDTGEKVTTFGSDFEYTLGAQTVTLYGNVTYLDCRNNQLTALDVNNNTALTLLDCQYNNINDANMTVLVNSLPTRTATDKGQLFPKGGSNVFTATHQTAAVGKNWEVVDPNEP